MTKIVSQITDSECGLSIWELDLLWESIVKQGII